MTSDPAISVVIPVRDGAAYLPQAIESALAQSPRPTEVVVVDDGSKDSSALLAESVGHPVSVIRLEASTGVGNARNTGIARATGEYLAFLDADDLWTQDKLLLQMRALEEDATLDAVFGHAVQFVSPELDESHAQRFQFRREPSPGIIAGALLIRRAAFERVGTFRTDVKVGEFVDWYARAQDAGLRITLLADVVLRRRLHTTNTGTREVDHRSDYARVLKTALERRRGRKDASRDGSES